MEETLYTDLIASYLSGNIEAAERERLWAWVEADAANRTFFDEMVQLWGMSANAPAENFATDTRVAWSKVESRLFGEKVILTEAPIIALQPQSSKKIVPLSIKRGWWAAAAVLLLAISVSIWMYTKPAENQPIVYTTSENERTLYTLPDSSKIWLNENTRLSFDKNFEQRIVQLEGEAFFDVEHLDGKPFTILSGEASTTVLGTTFNVRAYPTEKDVEVTVETGKVALSKTKNAKETVLLKDGKSGVFDKKTEEVKLVEALSENADAWKTKRLAFKNTPMREVLPTLERYFNIEISTENERLLNCTFTGTHDEAKLEDILRTMEYMSNFTIKIEKQANAYILRGNGCK